MARKLPLDEPMSASVNSDGPDTVRSPEGAWASAVLDDAGAVHVSVRCGHALDETVLSKALTRFRIAWRWDGIDFSVLGPRRPHRRPP